MIGGSSTIDTQYWRAIRLCGRRFGFDETGVVSAMFAPYEEGVPLLNLSTFSTNITLVEESELQRALAAFAFRHVYEDEDEEQDAGGESLSGYGSETLEPRFR